MRREGRIRCGNRRKKGRLLIGIGGTLKGQEVKRGDEVKSFRAMGNEK